MSFTFIFPRSSRRFSTMLIDRFGRTINYLRISITDRCNLRCIYCMPPEGVPIKRKSEILSYEEIYDFVKAAVRLGINKVRLTGGEPLIRKDIFKLIEMLASLSEIKDLALTTNGLLLAEYAVRLKAAGLHRVNISLDSLQPERYEMITRGGRLETVLKGIEAAKKGGLTPVKLNCVMLEGINQDEMNDFLTFGAQNGVEIQFIQHMKIDQHKPLIDDAVLIKRPPDCGICNRLRLTSDGFIKPCLLSNDEINIRSSGYMESILDAIARKPRSGVRCSNRSMKTIGG
jgi:cyclic pyranopterin phosphate synthase